MNEMEQELDKLKEEKQYEISFHDEYVRAKVTIKEGKIIDIIAMNGYGKRTKQ